MSLDGESVNVSELIVTSVDLFLAVTPLQDMSPNH